MPVDWQVEEPPIALEPDLKRLAALVEVFKQMDPAERRRALNYLNDRFAAVDALGPAGGTEET